MRGVPALWALTVVGVLGCRYQPPVDPNAPDRPEVYEGKFFTGPDGEKNWTMVKCAEDKAVCYQQAGLACPTGYDIGDSTDDTNTSSTTKSHAGAFGNQWGAGSSGVSRTYTSESHDMQMLIHCKPRSSSAGPVQRESTVVASPPPDAGVPPSPY